MMGSTLLVDALPSLSLLELVSIYCGIYVHVHHAFSFPLSSFIHAQGYLPFSPTFSRIVSLFVRVPSVFHFLSLWTSTGASESLYEIQ